MGGSSTAECRASNPKVGGSTPLLPEQVAEPYHLTMMFLSPRPREGSNFARVFPVTHKTQPLFEPSLKTSLATNTTPCTFFTLNAFGSG